MTEQDTTVGTTADGLVVIRAGELAKSIGVEDPFAQWFLTDEGRGLAQVAKDTDRVYEAFNLARYKFTTARLRALATAYPQLLVLGAGFDGRAIWLDEFRPGTTTIYELDNAIKLQQKQTHLQQNGIARPAWLRPVPGNLTDPKLPQTLLAKGLDPSQPLLVLAEGLFFFVVTQAVKAVLNPAWLGLAKGSRLIFDCWSTDRVQGLNAQLIDKIGQPLFHPFPYDTNPDNLQHTLLDLGYSHVTITPISDLAKTYFKQAVSDDYPSSWLIVEAEV